ncbi:MAG TPA: DNA/RNA non-specific endonuclease [Allosphingosinicella sp.]|jgi:endonuclease G
MFRQFITSFAIVVAMAASPADARRRSRSAVATAPSPATCDSYYLGHQPPRIFIPNDAGSGRIFCHSFYSLSYSTSYFNPIWTAYHLTREMAVGGDNTNRIKNKKFGRQAGLTPTEQGNHKDYMHPPFDRGHMTPANDAIDKPHQADTLVISNVVPQTIELNEYLWRYLEASVHRLARDEAEVYIVTGPIYTGTPVRMHKPGRTDRIMVPSHTFKAIYLPGRDIAVGYIAENTATPRCMIVSIDEVIRQSGLDPFPSLPASKKASVPTFALPQGDDVQLPDCRPATP